MTHRHITVASSGLRYLHSNDDFTGAVRVTLPMGERARDGHGVRLIDVDAQTVAVEIPFADLRHLVLQVTRERLIQELRDADDETLTRFLFHPMPSDCASEEEEEELCGRDSGRPGFPGVPCHLPKGHDDERCVGL